MVFGYFPEIPEGLKYKIEKFKSDKMDWDISPTNHFSYYQVVGNAALRIP